VLPVQTKGVYAQYGYAELIGRSWFLEPDSCDSFPISVLCLSSGKVHVELTTSLRGKPNTGVMGILLRKGSRLEHELIGDHAWISIIDCSHSRSQFHQFGDAKYSICVSDIAAGQIGPEVMKAAMSHP